MFLLCVVFLLLFFPNNITICLSTVIDNNRHNTYHHHHHPQQLKQFHPQTTPVKRLLTRLVIERAAERIALLAIQSLLARRIAVTDLQKHLYELFFEEKKLKRRVVSRVATRAVKWSSELGASLDALVIATSWSLLYEQLLHFSGLQEAQYLHWFRRSFVQCFTRQWLLVHLA